MEARHDVMNAGTARYIRASSMYSWQFAQAQYTAALHDLTRFVSMQPHYNLIYRGEERAMFPFCLGQKVAVTPWSSLAAGLLSGHLRSAHDKKRRVETDEYSGDYYSEGFEFLNCKSK